jgi:uncharacterized protein YjbJ (UPF0337 family)
MAAPVEPGPGCDLVWPGRTVAGNLGRRWADTDRVDAKHDCWVNQLAVQDDRAWRRDTHGEPAAAEQDVPIVKGMPTVGSLQIPTAMRASRSHVEPPRRTRRPIALPKEDVVMTINNRIESIVRGARYRIQQAKGRAKQTAGKATGSDGLRRKGKAEERRSRLNQFAKKIKDAITR